MVTRPRSLTVVLACGLLAASGVLVAGSTPLGPSAARAGTLNLTPSLGVGAATALAVPQVAPTQGAPTQVAAAPPSTTPARRAPFLPAAGLSTMPLAIPPEVVAVTPASTGPNSSVVADPLSDRLTVPILMYHRVIPPRLAGASLHDLVVAPDLFDAQMAALERAGWHSITAAQLATDLASGVKPARRTFVISFDDGYDDGYTYALPILERHHFVATYYVITGRIGETPYLTAEHIQELAAAGNEIGNHTSGHRDLAGLSAADIHLQVAAGSQRIAELTGTAPTTLAYPFGRWNAAVLAELRRDGYALAVTTVDAIGETYTNLLRTPRLRVGPGTSPAYLLAGMARGR